MRTPPLVGGGAARFDDRGQRNSCDVAQRQPRRITEPPLERYGAHLPHDKTVLRPRPTAGQLRALIERFTPWWKSARKVAP
jgi:hypothetical protein